MKILINGSLLKGKLGKIFNQQELNPDEKEERDLIEGYGLFRNYKPPKPGDHNYEYFDTYKNEDFDIYYFDDNFVYFRPKDTVIRKDDKKEMIEFRGHVFIIAFKDTEKVEEYSKLNSRFPLVGRKIMDDVMIRIPANLKAVTNI